VHAIWRVNHAASKQALRCSLVQARRLAFRSFQTMSMLPAHTGTRSEGHHQELEGLFTMLQSVGAHVEPQFALARCSEHLYHSSRCDSACVASMPSSPHYAIHVHIYARTHIERHKMYSCTPVRVHEYRHKPSCSDVRTTYRPAESCADEHGTHGARRRSSSPLSLLESAPDMCRCTASCIVRRVRRCCSAPALIVLHRAALFLSQQTSQPSRAIAPTTI
jgi:hypothetical protein